MTFTDRFGFMEVWSIHTKYHVYEWCAHRCIYFNLMNVCLSRWLLLETLDKVSPGIVNWKIATKPPIKMPFRKVENCNQVVKIGKQLKFSLVNIAGNDIVQGNKKLILGKCCHPFFFFFCLLKFIHFSFSKKLILSVISTCSFLVLGEGGGLV